MKKIFSFLSAVAFVFVLCSPVTAFAYNGPVCAPNADTDFYFVANQENTMRCPRYYSSYNVHRPELMKSYKEREDDWEFSIGSKSGLVKTAYPIKYLRGPAGGTESYLLKLWVSCDILGKIRTGAEK